MFCTKCGKQMPEGVLFCTACGNPMNAAPPKQGGQQKPQGFQQEQMPPQDDGYQRITYRAPVNNTPVKNAPARVDSKNRGAIIAIIYRNLSVSRHFGDNVLRVCV